MIALLSKRIFQAALALCFVCSVWAADADVQALADGVSQQQFSVYQHAIEEMGLGVYGGALYNQTTRGRSFAGNLGDKGNQEARKYLMETLAGFGLNAAVQSKFYNVVAEQTGVTNPKNVLIVAAHYDTIKANVPGGDGDASGTAGVLEAARVLSGWKFDNTIRYVVFNATAKKQAGSNNYLSNVLGFGTEKVIGVVYLDEILHPYHDKNPSLPQALSVGVLSKTGDAATWSAAFGAAAQKFVPALALDAGGPVLDFANDQFSFSGTQFFSSLRLSENSGKDVANASLGKPADASDGAAGAHYDYAFGANVVRAVVALVAQQAGFVGPNDGSAPAFLDSDGDGFSDEIETALNSDPASAASTPMNLAAATPAGYLETSNVAVSLNFSFGSSDLISVIGMLPVRAGFAPKDSVVIVNVAGVVKAITLNAAGVGTVGGNTFSLKFKSSKGVVASQLAQFSFVLGQGNFKKQFTPLGLVNLSASGKPVTIPVTVIFDGEVRSAYRILGYSASKDISGIARD